MKDKKREENRRKKKEKRKEETFEKGVPVNFDIYQKHFFSRRNLLEK